MICKEELRMGCELKWGEKSSNRNELNNRLCCHLWIKSASRHEMTGTALIIFRLVSFRSGYFTENFVETSRGHAYCTGAKFESGKGQMKHQRRIKKTLYSQQHHSNCFLFSFYKCKNTFSQHPVKCGNLITINTFFFVFFLVFVKYL